ncbi:FAD-dependent monooxygenase [Caldalkalibacillus mannanilyticus]|uniref:FAD-dependent monooxygenase n=1 Tax=Caldalkalibacillus mannanilyticus TaxID=1418 RepID=UPI00046819E9|nr:FAD-dependent monooxygenase [Caldalkalibacillus mannanilyticus]
MKIGIIGAGIAGITAALSLIQKGYSIQLFEKADDYRPLGAGIVLGNNALLVFEELGLYEQIQAHSVIPTDSYLMSWKGTILASIKPFEKNKNRHSFAILSRTKLFEILRSRLPNNLVSFNKSCAKITQNKTSVQIKFEDGTEYQCDLLLACDGIYSTVRQTIFPKSTIRYAGYTCWRGVTQPLTFDTQKTFIETWGRNGRFGIAPIEDNRYYWYALKNSMAKDQRYVQWTKADLLQNFEHYHSPIQELLLATNENAIMQHDIYDLKPIQNYSKGRVALLGDAAHATTPNLGQGACQAIEDGYAIAKALDTHSDLDQALQSYQKARRKPATQIVNLSWSFGKVAQLESVPLCSIRDQLLHTQYRLLTKVTRSL